MQKDKKNIRELSLEELIFFFGEHGEKPFRAKQVYEWLWKKSVHSFIEMSNLSSTARTLLLQYFAIRAVKVGGTQVSKDKTIKSVFRLHDDNVVEGVLIPAEDRMTACVSSQVGCSLTCSFCATGKLERIRNLTVDEIYDQVVHIRNQAVKHYNTPLTNIVFMGMGEPLLNYTNVLKSIEKITSEDGLNMSPQRVTVSTAGIAKMISKLGDEQIKFNLALSLHAANDKKRNEIMPINETNSLKELANALRYFYDKTGTRITYEYIILKDFNDLIKDAKELADFCKKVPCKVNIIEYNPIEKSEFKNATAKKTESFKQYLESKDIIVNIRKSRGKDIDAACGQLANKAVMKECVEELV